MSISPCTFSHTHSAVTGPIQFAFLQFDDAILTLLHLAHSLEASKASVKILFVDFSSAFITIKPYILAQRLARVLLRWRFDWTF